VAALLAVLAALVAGGALGWGLRHARASDSPAPAAGSPATPTPRSTTTPSAPASPSALTQPQRRRVVMLGDSLTYGSGLEAPQDPPSVVRRLRPELDVIGMAVGGTASSDLVGRTRQFRLLHPDEAVIWVGSQDADEQVPLSTYRDNMEKLLAALAPARVVLVTPIADYAVGASLYVPYAAATRDLARAHNLPLVDLGSVPRSAYQADATHLDAANAARVAGMIARAL
jgi:lysophospholipase L1-like esterase